MNDCVEFLRKEAVLADDEGVPVTAARLRVAADELERLREGMGLLKVYLGSSVVVAILGEQKAADAAEGK